MLDFRCDIEKYILFSCAGTLHYIHFKEKNLISVLRAITSATRFHATTKTHTSSILQCDLICKTVYIAFLYHHMADWYCFYMVHFGAIV